MTAVDTVILHRGKLIYYIREESVVVQIGQGAFVQYVGYNTFMMQNRKPFYAFRTKVLESGDGEYDSAVAQMSLANELGLIGVATSKPPEAVE